MLQLYTLSCPESAYADKSPYVGQCIVNINIICPQKLQQKRLPCSIFWAIIDLVQFGNAINTCEVLSDVLLPLENTVLYELRKDS